MTRRTSSDAAPTSGGRGGAVALGQLGVTGCCVVVLLVAALPRRRVPKQEALLVAAAAVFVGGPGRWSRRGRRDPGGGLVVGGGRSGRHPGAGRALRPLRWEEEGAVVGVLVQVGVGPPGLGRLGGRGGTCAGGDLCELVFELLHLPSQPLHGVGVVCRDGVGERLRMEIFITVSTAHYSGLDISTDDKMFPKTPADKHPDGFFINSTQSSFN